MVALSLCSGAYKTIWGKSLFAATIMKISYGIDVQESDDPYISRAEDALDGVNQAAIPGAFWVDLFPVLKYVPSWFPGAGFQKKATHWRELNAIMIETPFSYVEEQLVGDHFFSRAHEVVHTRIFCSKREKLRHPWQCPSLSVFLMRTILNCLWRKSLRKMWLLCHT
jgi:hypothetical protein